MSFSLLLLLSCSVFPLFKGADTGDTAGCDRSPPLDYDTFGQGMMNKHCNGCHSSYLPEGQRFDAPVGVDLNTYQGVLTYAERIQARTIDAETMPPGGGLSADELVLIDEWLVCGVYRDIAQLEREAEGTE